jgi:hypothetical protein
MYRPDGGSSLFLAADASKGYSLGPIISRLAESPAPIVVANWDGESKPFLPQFISPGRLAEIDGRAAAPKSDQRPRGTNNSVEYSMVLSGTQRRPNARMPVDGQ